MNRWNQWMECWVGVRAPCSCVNTERIFRRPTLFHIIIDCAHRAHTNFTHIQQPSVAHPLKESGKTFLRWCSCAFFPPAHTRNINKNRFAAVLQELSLRLDVLCSGRRTRVVLTCKRFSDSLLHSTYWLSRRRRLRKIGELDNRGGENFTMRKFFESFSARESSKFLLTARRNVKSVKICK